MIPCVSKTDRIRVPVRDGGDLLIQIEGIGDPALILKRESPICINGQGRIIPILRAEVAAFVIKDGLPSIPSYQSIRPVVVERQPDVVCIRPAHAQHVILAAEAIIEAFKVQDYSKTGLRSYGNRLAESFVMKDLKKYRRLGGFLYHHKEIFTQLPELASFGAREIITVNGVSKKDKEKSILTKIRKVISIPRVVRLIWQAWRATR